MAIAGGEFRLHVLVARKLVEARYGQIVLGEPVPRPRGVELVVRHDLEAETKATIEFVLPLLYEASGADDEAALQITASYQLLDEKPRHDRLPSTQNAPSVVFDSRHDRTWRLARSITATR